MRSSDGLLLRHLGYWRPTRSARTADTLSRTADPRSARPDVLASEVGFVMPNTFELPPTSLAAQVHEISLHLALDYTAPVPTLLEANSACGIKDAAGVPLLEQVKRLQGIIGITPPVRRHIKTALVEAGYTIDQVREVLLSGTCTAKPSTRAGPVLIRHAFAI